MAWLQVSGLGANDPCAAKIAAVDRQQGRVNDLRRLVSEAEVGWANGSVTRDDYDSMRAQFQGATAALRDLEAAAAECAAQEFDRSQAKYVPFTSTATKTSTPTYTARLTSGQVVRTSEPSRGTAVVGTTRVGTRVVGTELPSARVGTRVVGTELPAMRSTPVPATRSELPQWAVPAAILGSGLLFALLLRR